MSRGKGLWGGCCAELSQLTLALGASKRPFRWALSEEMQLAKTLRAGRTERCTYNLLSQRQAPRTWAWQRS